MKFSDHSPLDYYPILIEHELNLLMELLNLNQRWLDNNLEELSKYAEGFPEELQEMLHDDVVAARDDLPRLTYIGLYVVLFAFIENTMRQMAIYCVPEDRLSGEKIMEGYISDVSSELLRQGAMKNRLVFNNEFTLVKDLRNACNHTSARLDKKGRESYKAMRKRKPFSELNVDTNSGQIEFTPKFMSGAVDWARECLVEMANDLGRKR